MELASEFKTTPDFWIEQPWVYALWVFHTVLEKRYRDQWSDRMRREDTAELTALAFHEPNKLERERDAILAIARRLPRSADEQTAHVQALLRGRQMAGEHERGNVLRD